MKNIEKSVIKLEIENPENPFKAPKEPMIPEPFPEPVPNPNPDPIPEPVPEPEPFPVPPEPIPKFPLDVIF